MLPSAVRYLACLLVIVLLAAAPVALRADTSATLRGRVVDDTDAVIPRASVVLYRSAGAPVATTVADEQGRFLLAGIPRGQYEVVARAAGLEPASTQVDVGAEPPAELVLRLRVGAVTSSVTVTASRGVPEDAESVPTSVSIVTSEQKSLRPGMLLPQLLRGEPGVQVQQTSAHQGAVIIRGLTGQQVLHLIDGVRFNTSTFRPGPNQYLATVDESFVERVEISRGPHSMQYGSDSLGGTLNLLPPRPYPATRARRWQGEFAPFFRSADLAGGSTLRLSYGADKWYVIGGGSARRAQDLRAGQGGDSHAAVTRFLGLAPTVLGSRLQDTAFTQWAGYLRFFWNARPDQSFSVTYHRGEQLGGRRYDQLNGGNGNLLNSFDPQVLDFFYARYEKQRLGWLDSLQGTFSYNRQRDDRRFQGGSGNPLAAITDDDSVTSAFGYQLQGTAHLGGHQVLLFGGEAYDEYIAAAAQRFDPVSRGTAAIRGRFPDGTRYTSYGFFLQHTAELAHGRLRTQSGVRTSGIHFRVAQALLPAQAGSDFSTALHDVTFQAGAAYRLWRGLSLFGSVSRGFRAPNVNDFSSLGLTSNGFEVSPDEAGRVGALVGTTAGNDSVSSGTAVRQLEPETLWDFEGGLRLQAGPLSARVSGFHYGLRDFITKRAVILPTGATGSSIGGVAIAQQLSSGAVITALDPRPVITRVNIGQVRIRGFEAESVLRLTSAWQVSSAVSYLRGVDVQTGGAPDLEGGFPPVNGISAVRWHRAGKSYWFEAYTHWSDKQARISSLELADQRIGAVRSRSSIAAFFNNGAVARGLVRNGVLQATGETLAQVQDRVLGAGVQSAPMFTKTPGFATLNLRGGYRVSERDEFVWVLENLLDKNYRVHGSGVDGAGRNLQITYLLRF